MQPDSLALYCPADCVLEWQVVLDEQIISNSATRIVLFLPQSVSLIATHLTGWGTSTGVK